MNEYHGIVINLSQEDASVINELDIIGKRQVLFNALVLYKVRVTANNLEVIIQRLQAHMRYRFGWFIRSFYFHFYNDHELIVVFKEKIFRTVPDPAMWSEIIAYGRSLGIPRKQLDFFPCRFSDETY
jgi:hypothetical protein